MDTKRQPGAPHQPRLPDGPLPAASKDRLADARTRRRERLAGVSLRYIEGLRDKPSNGEEG